MEIDKAYVTIHSAITLISVPFPIPFLLSLGAAWSDVCPTLATRGNQLTRFGLVLGPLSVQKLRRQQNRHLGVTTNLVYWRLSAQFRGTFLILHLLEPGLPSNSCPARTRPPLARVAGRVQRLQS